MNRLYLDTSIPSAYFDYSKPVRQLITQRWFESEIKNYKIYVSTIVFEELSRYKNMNKREAIEDLLIEKKVVTIDITEEAVLLAEKYIKENYKIIEIGSLEIFGGAKYGNLS